MQDANGQAVGLLLPDRHGLVRVISERKFILLLYPQLAIVSAVMRR